MHRQQHALREAQELELPRVPQHQGEKAELRHGAQLHPEPSRADWEKTKHARFKNGEPFLAQRNHFRNLNALHECKCLGVQARKVPCNHGWGSWGWSVTTVITWLSLNSQCPPKLKTRSGPSEFPEIWGGVVFVLLLSLLFS